MFNDSCAAENVENDNVVFGLRRRDILVPINLSERHANDRRILTLIAFFDRLLYQTRIETAFSQRRTLQ